MQKIPEAIALGMRKRTPTMSAMQIIDVSFTNLREDETWDSPKMKGTWQFKSTLVVPADVPAVPAARIADANEIQLIMVRSSEGDLAGILLPAWTCQQISSILQLGQFTTLTEALEAYEADPKARSRQYRSELLNHDRPAMYWCSGGHVVPRCPCDKPGHEKYGCSIEDEY